MLRMGMSSRVVAGCLWYVSRGERGRSGDERLVSTAWVLAGIAKECAETARQYGRVVLYRLGVDSHEVRSGMTRRLDSRGCGMRSRPDR